MQPVDGSESRPLHSSPSNSAKLARNARFRGGPGLELGLWSRISFPAIMTAADLHRFDQLDDLRKCGMKSRKTHVRHGICQVENIYLSAARVRRDSPRESTRTLLRRSRARIAMGMD
jgi:hypothetical protein